LRSGRATARCRAAAGRRSGRREPFAEQVILDLPDLLEPERCARVHDTRVIPAELQRRANARRGLGGISVTLIERLAPDRWQLCAGQPTLKPGDRVIFGRGAMSACSRARSDGQERPRDGR